MTPSDRLSGSRPLPPHSSLEQLKKQAKDLLKERRASGQTCALHEAQLALARDYGFPSWEKLKLHVENSKATELFAAAKRGDERAVRRLVRAEPTLAIRWVAGDNERTALHFAAREGHIGVVEALLEAGADPLAGVYPNRQTTRALDFARLRGHDAVVKLIEQHLARHGSSAAGDAIITVVRTGDINQVRDLLDRDASFANVHDHNGEAPLHEAVRDGRLALIELLLERGADMEAVDGAGLRPIHAALYGGHPERRRGSLEAAALLLDRGARIDLWTAAGLGRGALVREFLKADHDAASSPLVEWPAGPRVWPASVVFPLSIAAFHNQTVICRLLLDHGADPDASHYGPFPGDVEREFGMPMYAALRHINHELVGLLLERGATPDLMLRGIGSALYFAYEAKDDRLVSILLERGAKMSAGFCLARGMRREAIERMKEDPGEAYSVACGAVAGDDIELFDLSMAHVGTLTPQQWFTLLAGAVGHKFKRFTDGPRRVLTLRRLLKVTPDVNVRGWEGVTVLHLLGDPNVAWMAQAMRVALAGELLGHGADATLRDEEYDSTPAGFAARSGYVELMRFYIERGVDVAENDATPSSRPLAWAERGGHREIVELLRSISSEPNR